MGSMEGVMLGDRQGSDWGGRWQGLVIADRRSWKATLGHFVKTFFELVVGSRAVVGNNTKYYSAESCNTQVMKRKLRVLF